MTAKQELKELVDNLREDEAERILPVVKRECGRDKMPEGGNAGRLLELMKEWRKEDEAMDPEERARIHEVLDNVEPVRFRQPEEL